MLKHQFPKLAEIELFYASWTASFPTDIIYSFSDYFVFSFTS